MRRRGGDTYKTQAIAGAERWSGLGDAIVSCMRGWERAGMENWKAKGKYMQEMTESTTVGFTQGSRTSDSEMFS